MDKTINRHKKIWIQKRILRSIYNRWYKKIVDNLVEGKTLEIGSGTGNFKEYKPDIMTSDINKSPWIDYCFDANKIPFKKETISNIVLIDTFHHLKNPIGFLNEACRVLKKNGRIIMVEPHPSLFSLFIYKKFHKEPFDFKINYFKKKKFENKKPWESNQAIPFIIFEKNRDKFDRLFKNKLKIVSFDKTDFVVYPLSGGFDHNQILPNILLYPFFVIEFLLKPLKKFLAFKCIIVIKKMPNPSVRAIASNFSP